MREAGVADYEATGWMGLFVPAATPPDTAAALATACMPLLAEASLAARIVAAGSDPALQDGPSLWRFIADELYTWRRLAEVAGIALD